MDTRLEIQRDYNEMRVELENYQTAWGDWKLELVKYLPKAKVRINKVDNHFTDAWRYLECVSQAEDRRQKLRTFWWNILLKATLRDIEKLIADLGNCGIKAQV